MSPLTTAPRHRLRPFRMLPLACCVLAASGCAESDPETETGIDKPAVTGVVTGDIKNRRQLADAIEAKNKANDEHRANNDWRYAKPAVGPAE